MLCKLKLICKRIRRTSGYSQRLTSRWTPYSSAQTRKMTLMRQTHNLSLSSSSITRRGRSERSSVVDGLPPRIWPWLIVHSTASSLRCMAAHPRLRFSYKSQMCIQSAQVSKVSSRPSAQRLRASSQFPSSHTHSLSQKQSSTCCFCHQLASYKRRFFFLSAGIETMLAKCSCITP